MKYPFQELKNTHLRIKSHQYDTTFIDIVKKIIVSAYQRKKAALKATFGK